MHYAPLYGSGSLHTKILYLIQTNKNSFDYLEINESANENAHAIYNKIYNRQFRGQTLRDGSSFNKEVNPFVLYSQDQTPCFNEDCYQAAGEEG
jgi:hypothetical protein